MRLGERTAKCESMLIILGSRGSAPRVPFLGAVLLGFLEAAPPFAQGGAREVGVVERARVEEARHCVMGDAVVVVVVREDGRVRNREARPRKEESESDMIAVLGVGVSRVFG
jgi:hypothetical protein